VASDEIVVSVLVLVGVVSASSDGVGGGNKLIEWFID